MGQSTKFLMTRDIGGYNGFGVPFCNDGEQAVLAQNTEQHVTVPSTHPYWLAVFSFSPGSNVWVDGTTTATFPAGSFAATTSDLNPSARLVKAGTTLSFITNDTTNPYVKVSFYTVLPQTL